VELLPFISQLGTGSRGFQNDLLQPRDGVGGGMQQTQQQQVQQQTHAAKDHAAAAADDMATTSTSTQSLLPGWTEAMDPAGSGGVYYYNAATGESSWERPVGAIVVVADNDNANAVDAAAVDTTDQGQDSGTVDDNADAVPAATVEFRYY
jgi:hypothetical protein